MREFPWERLMPSRVKPESLIPVLPVPPPWRNLRKTKVTTVQDRELQGAFSVSKFTVD